jgi:hypothetical protein
MDINVDFYHFFLYYCSSIFVFFSRNKPVVQWA